MQETSISNNRSLYITFLVLAFIFGGLFIWYTRAPATSEATRIQAAEQQEAMPQKGFAAPDFELESSSGEMVSLSQFQGQPVIVNFWATWCAPCRAELPDFQRVSDTYGDQGLTFLLLNQAEDAETAQSFLDDLGINMTTLLDKRGEVANMYRVRGLPTTVFVRPDGTIHDIVVGGPISEAKLTENVEQLVQ